MITVQCTECGQPIQRREYHVKLTKKPFCGFKCYAAWQARNNIGRGRNRVAVSCANCGSEFEKVPSAVLKFNFCSRECYNEWRSVTGVNAGSQNPAWRGGHSAYRGANWYRQRKAARARDNNTCQRCGIHGASFPVHHVIPFRLFTDYREANRLENLQTMCPTCHGIAEQEYWVNHPELKDKSPFPIVAPIQECRKCGKEFTPRSGATLVCDECCTSVCAHCGQQFYSRKAVHRPVKYCSRECRNASIERKTQICEGCGISFIADRPGVKFCSQRCHMAHSNPRRKSSPTT